MSGLLEQTLLPFDPRIHVPQDVGLGGASTEYLATDKLPNGLLFNYPTIWFDAVGNAHPLNGDAAYNQARQYEQETGRNFPRFLDVDTAVSAAKARSRLGGASSVPLMDWQPFIGP